MAAPDILQSVKSYWLLFLYRLRLCMKCNTDETKILLSEVTKPLQINTVIIIIIIIIIVDTKSYKNDLA